MSTFSEYSSRYDRIRSLLFSISSQITFLYDEVRRGAVLGPPDNIGSRADEIDNVIDASIDSLNLLSEQIASSNLTASQQASLQRVIVETGNGYLDEQQRLIEIRSRAEQNKQQQKLKEQSPPKNSSAEVAEEKQTAQVDKASLQSPDPEPIKLDQNGRIVPRQDNVSGKNTTNSINPADEVDNDDTANQGTVSEFGNKSGSVSTVGGAGETNELEKTQKPSAGPGRDQQGEIALSDDSQDVTQTTTGNTTTENNRPTIANEFLQVITPKGNILSGLGSMTYTLSLYLMSPLEYAQLVAAQKKVLTTSQLLIQSGGAPISERNRWFNVDFYIDNLQLDSVVGTQGAGSPHNAVTLEFTVTEPQGITFFNRLNNAVIDHIGSDGNVNPILQNYLMVIRFYGTDIKGRPVNSAQLGLDPTTDENAIVEKFIPFIISDFRYKVDTKATEYNIKGTCHGTNTAFSSLRGSIPFNLQLIASDLKTLLNGNAVIAEQQQQEQQEEQDPAGNVNNNGNKTAGLKGATIAQGLVDALNQHQQRLYEQGTYAVPDQYEIVIEDTPGLIDAKLAKPGFKNKARTPNNLSQNAAQKFLESKTVYDKETEIYSVLAGTQIVQLLDLVLKTSTYVTSQQNVIFDEKTGLVKNNSERVNTVQWYRIRSQVTPLGWDEKRKDQAFKMTYIVSRYQINTPRTPNFPPAKYRGVHKMYDYWFTGQNTEVLDFSIDVNSNYFVSIGNDGFIDETPDGKYPARQAYSVAPGGSLQGGTRNSTAPAANLSDRLYSMADVATSDIEIVGDPDWIQQSEIFYNKTIDLNPFMPDGSVNYDASEVLFELRFNPIVDYDLRTGLSPVYENNIIRDSLTGEVNIPQENIVWAATTVISSFNQGSFTQRLSGVYRPLEASVNPPATVSSDGTIINDRATVDTVRRGVIDESDVIDDSELTNSLPPSKIKNKATLKSEQTPVSTRRLQNNNGRLSVTNFNVDSDLPFRDIEENGDIVRVYGNERDLLQYYGSQAVQPKPGAGENAVDSDAGEYVRKGFI